MLSVQIQKCVCYELIVLNGVFVKFKFMNISKNKLLHGLYCSQPSEPFVNVFLSVIFQKATYSAIIFTTKSVPVEILSLNFIHFVDRTIYYVCNDLEEMMHENIAT